MILKIITHSGREYEVDVENYSAEQVNADLNNKEINTLAFSDVIVSRIDVKAVVPIKNEPEEEIEAE